MQNYSPFIQYLLAEKPPYIGLYIPNMKSYPDPFNWTVNEHDHMLWKKSYSVVGHKTGITTWYITGECHSKQVCEKFIKLAQDSWILFL